MALCYVNGKFVEKERNATHDGAIWRISGGGPGATDIAGHVAFWRALMRGDDDGGGGVDVMRRINIAIAGGW